DGAITPEYLTACVRRLLEDEDALVLTEVVTNSKIVAEHLRPNHPGSVIHHGGAALGWAGGAAVGAKLAAPGQTVVSLVGRLLPVRRAVLGAVGSPPVRHALADRYLRQPGLGGT